MSQMQEILEKVRTVSAEEAETVQYVVCSDNSYFEDDARTQCAFSDCGRVIYHRPSAPNKPLKICLGCFFRVVEKTKKQEES